MSELLDPSCFLGLSPEERMEQLYLAYGGTECFLGLSLMIERLRLLAEQIGIEGCIFSEVDFYRGWLALLDPDACAEPSLQALQGAVYASLYASAGDDTLVSPECFYGLSPDQREQALFAVTGGSDVHYSISRDPTSLSLFNGESGNVLITLTLLSGPPEMATLTVPDLPVGWGAIFSDNPISTDGGTSTMTLTAP